MENNTKFNLQDLDKYLRKWLNNPHIVELMQDCVHESVEENQPPKPVNGKVDIDEYARSVVLNELIRSNIDLTTNIVALYNAADSLAGQFADDYLTDIQQVDLFGLDAGQHFLYKDIEFVKLGDEQNGILCITAKVWKILPFDDKNGSNNFEKSSICKVLHKKFCPLIKFDALQIYTMDLIADNGDDTYGLLCVYAGLLSADLYRKYRKYIPKYNRWIWLCTPWHCSNCAKEVRCVTTGGPLCNFCVDKAHGVVPAVVFNKYTAVRLKN